MNEHRNLRIRFSLLTLAALSFAATAKAHEGHQHDAMGTVKAVEAAELDLETTEGKLESFVLTAETTYERGDAAATHHDVAVGDRAVVTYEKKDGKSVALEVKLGAKKTSGHGGHQDHEAGGISGARP
jgi:hypothetical protein